MQYEFDAHEQLPDDARGDWACCRLVPPMYAGHDRLLPLADPSLQTNTSPSQCDIPPLLPLHGALWECAYEPPTSRIAAQITIKMVLANVVITKKIERNFSYVRRVLRHTKSFNGQ